MNHTQLLSAVRTPVGWGAIPPGKLRVAGQPLL